MKDKTNFRLVIAFCCFFLCFLSGTATAQAAEPPRRIVSLAPSTTEILFALGLGDTVVGVTSFCDYPEEAKAKPKIGGMSNPSLEAIVSLRPDLVVMTTDGNPKEVEVRLHSMKIATYIFRARRLHELPNGIRELGTAVGAGKQAEALAKNIEKALAAIRSQKSGAGSQKKILFIVWPEPLIVAGPGTAMDDAIRLLGHENLAGTAKASYPKYSIEEALRQEPEVLIIGKATGMDISSLSQGILKKLARIPAVKNGKVFYVSDGLYRLGPRVVKGIEELAECLK